MIAAAQGKMDERAIENLKPSVMNTEDLAVNTYDVVRDKEKGRRDDEYDDQDP